MFDNDDSTQRASLIRALSSIGLEAWELNSGGGTMHVIVTLLDNSADPPLIAAEDPRLRAYLEVALRRWPDEASLYIATNSLNTDCDIGLCGNDGQTGAQVASRDWQHVSSLDEAVALFRQIWVNRDKWLRALATGKLEIQ